MEQGYRQLLDGLRATRAALNQVETILRAELGLPGRGSLTCVECGRIADEEASGWKVFLTEFCPTDDHDDLPKTATYCPECAAREFGASP